MGRKLSFRPGSFYRTDDRTGFPQRAERTRKEWTGLIVDDEVYDRRHPQDLVRGVRDDQTVPNARPLPPNVFTGPVYYALELRSRAGAFSFTPTYLAGLYIGAQIGIMTDLGEVFNTLIAPGDALLDSDGEPLLDSDGNALYDNNGVAGPSLGITTRLPAPAAAGNLVILYGVIL